MNSFFEHFYPKMLDVVCRTESFWKEQQYVVKREGTRIYNFCSIYSGTGTLELNGSRYPVSSGSLFHLAPGDDLCLTSSVTDPLCYYSIQFYHWPLKWEGNSLYITHEYQALPFERLFYLGNDAASTHFELKALHNAWSSKEAGYEWYARLKFLMLLHKIAQYMDERLLQDDETMRQVRATIQFVNENYRYTMNRDQLAQMASLSPSYYSTLFKKYSGYSPVEYIHKVRIDKAKELLKATQEPISKIAKDIGFQDPLYFTRLFAIEVGMSPRKFRNA